MNGEHRIASEQYGQTWKPFTDSTQTGSNDRIQMMNGEIDLLDDYALPLFLVFESSFQIQ